MQSNYKSIKMLQVTSRRQGLPQANKESSYAGQKKQDCNRKKTSITLLHVILLQPRLMHWLRNGWFNEQLEITEPPSRRAGY